MGPRFFDFKKKLERNTRPFTCFKEAELLRVFQNLGFVRVDRYPEFFLPMVFHRILGRPSLSSGAEAAFRLLGITSWFGSPVILKLVREGRSRR
jgi:hypothetical protein